MPGFTRDLRSRKGGYGGRKPFQARWTHPNDPRVKRDKSFATKREARAWMAESDAAASRGAWVDPQVGKLLFEYIAAEWLIGRRVKIGPRTLTGYELILKRHLLPEFGQRRIASIDGADIQRFVNRLADYKSPATVHSIIGVLNAVMTFAVRRGRIAVNPCVGVERPSKARRVQIKPLMHTEVRALADSMPTEQDRLVILIAAYMGLRAGELWGLQHADVNPLRRELTVARSLKEITERHAERLPEGHTRITPSLIMGPTKTKAVRRLRIPGFLLDELAGSLNSAPGFLFVAPEGGPVRHTNWTKRVWAKHRPPGIRFHDLRHTCASLLIEQGRHPVEIAKHLGHRDVTTTLNIYSHMLPSTEQAMADAMDRAWRASADGGNVERIGGAV